MRQRLLIRGAWAGAALALAGALGVLLGDGPYLRLSALSPWIVVYAVGLFGLLLFAPFAIHRHVAGSSDDRDRRWELAVVVWGGLALAAAALLVLVGLVFGLDGASPLGALALVGLAECALVAGAVLTVILSSG